MCQIRSHFRAPSFYRAILATSFFLMMGTAVSTGQASGPDLLVSVDWLAEHFEDPNVLLLHVGPDDQYQAEHIPGAVYAWYDDYTAPNRRQLGQLVLELPDLDDLQAVLESYGVSDDSRIVVYWGSGFVTPSTRLMFTLDWAGLGDRTVLLNGGLEAWKAAGHEVTATVPEPTAGNLTLRPRHDVVVDAAWMREYLAVIEEGNETQLALIDARSPASYSGERDTGREKPGHIPGAGSLFWRELIIEDVGFKDADALRELFAAAGVKQGETIVAYCHIGQYATAVMFAARILGYDVKLYDGSMQDWTKRDLPTVKSQGR